MLQALILNAVYAIFSGILTIIGMRMGFKMLDRVTHFDTSEELKNGNTAVGLTVCGMFIGVGIAMGLVIGMAVN
jgi:uncharacterized membrane protein YjfL (UPF0719 family)